MGLQTALYLKDESPALRIAIVERDDPPAGASTRNAGFACVGSIGELIDDEELIGLEATISLVERRLEGLNLLRKRIPDKLLEFRECGNLEWYRQGEEDYFTHNLSKLEAFNKALREHINFKDDMFRHVDPYDVGLPASSAGAILNSAEGELNPGRMITYLQQECAKAGVRSFRESVKEITKIRPGQFVLNLESDRSLTSSQVILATNAFTSGLITSEIKPALNQVIVTEPIEGLTWSIPMHLEKGYGYIRRIGNRVLVGGFRHRYDPIIEHESFNSKGTNQFPLSEALGQHLRQVLREVLPENHFPIEIQNKTILSNEIRIEYEWSGVLGLGYTRNPQVVTTTNGVIVAAGLGGMGVALGSLLAKEAAKIAFNLA